MRMHSDTGRGTAAQARPEDRAHRARLEVGATIPAVSFTSIAGETIAFPQAGANLVHIQFRRFAGCPVCNLHLRSFVRRRDDVAAAGIRELVLFHSSPDVLRTHTADLPFAVVADPDRRLYRAFGVESAPRALLDPRVWATIVRAVAIALPKIVAGRLPPPDPTGGRLGLPADFLVAPDGRIRACSYGVHADDQWSVDELLALARSCR
jgi:peroxiredoxin